MPDVARKRLSFGTRSPAARRTVAATFSESDARSARSDSHLLLGFERRRPRGATGRFMHRLDLSMRAVSVQWLIGSLGAIAALVTALSIPIGYAFIGYINRSETLSIRAEVNAARAETIIAASPSGWRTDTGALARVLESRGAGAAPVKLRIRDAQGTIVLEQGEKLAAPTHTRSASIAVAGEEVGRAVVTASLRPLLMEALLIALATLPLALAAYFVFAILPLKVLHRSLGDLGSANARFRRQNMLLDAALANMFQGLAMFDTDERLVIANNRFAEMYGLTPEDVVPGTPLRGILEQRTANGLYAEETAERQLEAMRQHFSRRKVTHWAERLSDGRAILVSIRPRPGGGWVTTHQDVTERENLNAELAQQNELLREREDQLEQQRERLDVTLNNMSHGVAMFDAGQRLVVCNKLYAEMYGLSAELVAPGMPSQRIFDHLVAASRYSDTGAAEIQSWMRNRLAGRGGPHHVSELGDGRSIAVSAQQMPGGGIVTTHQDITEQRRAEAKIVHMALHDTLTGLPNRVLLNERLERALTRVRRGEVVAVHMLDLDRFKAVNDTLGHPAGDKLLKTVADRLRGLVRETDTVARIGGDEFAIVQVAIAHPSDATTLAQRIIEVVSKPYEIEGYQVAIGTSVGIAMGPANGVNPAELTRNADLALCRAKGELRGSFCFFEPEMDAQMQARRAMEYDLRRGMTAGEFELHYQPVVNLESNEISGFEALARWRHPKNGMVPPSTFIPLAEDVGSIVALGEWVMRNACTTAATWPTHLSVAVNLSPVQLRSPALGQMVVGALNASGLAPERLELEITETVLLGDCDTTLNVLSRLRDMGVRIAMDDFGTGYSSLSYLQNFNVDKIKIDSSFVRGAAADAGSLNIVRAVTAMAKGLGMVTTAEGVETAEQLEIARSEGCTEVQGFYFGQPVLADEIETLLSDVQILANGKSAGTRLRRVAAGAH